MKEWIKKNPNKCGMLIMLTLGWARVMLHKYFGLTVSPETENYVLEILTVFGLYSTTRRAPPAQ